MTSPSRRHEHPCSNFTARPGSRCATCGWPSSKHEPWRLTAFGFRASTRRNGGDWVAITRRGALVHNHLLRAARPDRAAAEAELADLVERLGLVDAR